MAGMVVFKSATRLPIATFINVESSAIINEDNETIIIAVQPISEGLESLSNKISPDVNSYDTISKFF
jgi:tetrahydromethanopterin S-methyltransferase subunit B